MPFSVTEFRLNCLFVVSDHVCASWMRGAPFFCPDISVRLLLWGRIRCTCLARNCLHENSVSPMRASIKCWIAGRTTFIDVFGRSVHTERFGCGANSIHIIIIINKWVRVCHIFHRKWKDFNVELSWIRIFWRSLVHTYTQSGGNERTCNGKNSFQRLMRANTTTYVTKAEP